jgi:KDO2-lipid IV(A) lauroyltransferase
MVSSDVTVSVSLLGRITIGAFRVIGALPFSVRSKLGFALGYFIGTLPTRERRITQKQLNLFLPEKNASRLTPRVFGNAARATLESLNLRAICAQPEKYVTCSNWSTVQSWLNEDRPLVVLTAHTGNWDLLAAYGIARGARITTIGREARVLAVHEALKWMREQYGVETIWRSDRAGLKRLLSCFRERRVIAALIDQDTKVESVFVPFFGRPTRTPSSLIELGKKFNARFVYAFIVRTSTGRFDLRVGEIANALETESILSEYSAQLQAIIESHPEQWVWFHKRWRSDPSGTTLGSRQYLAWLTEEALRSAKIPV